MIMAEVLRGAHTGVTPVCHHTGVPRGAGTGAPVAVDVRKIVQMYRQCHFDQFQMKLWKGAIL